MEVSIVQGAPLLYFALANQRRRPFSIERTGRNIKGQFCMSHVPSVIQNSSVLYDRLRGKTGRKTTFS